MTDDSIQRHSDAIGYLDELVNEINQPWFKILRDITVLTGASILHQETLDRVSALFLGETDSIPVVNPEAMVPPIATSASSADFLEQLSAFSNFKLLYDTLQVDFKKPITLVFGTNGSGKSSLCESFRVLANQSKPSRPIENVRTSSAGDPTFAFKFRSDSTSQTWTPASGYGLHADKIKYFDSTIAVQNVSTAVEPGRVIALTPFKLNLFENIKALTAQLREALKDKYASNATTLNQAFTELRSECSDFNGRPLASIDVSTMDVLAREIAHAETFDQHKELAVKLASAVALEKATSDEGLALLKAEHRELEIITKSLQTLITSAKALWVLEPVSKANKLEGKRIEQKALADALIPKGTSLEKLMALLKSASGICEFDKAAGQVCPLCQRELEETQVELFSQYHDLLTGQLESEITALKTDISAATRIVETIGIVNPQDWDKLSSLSSEMLMRAKAAASLVVADCGVEVEPSRDAKSALETLEELVRTGIEQLKLKAQAIESSTKGRGEVLQQLETLRLQIEPLAYYEFLFKRLDKLQNIQQKIEMAISLSAAISTFKPLLTKITNTAKTAYEELVVYDFEARLNAEYINLTEKEMNAFSVALKRIGADATVTVMPQIGGNGISGVLSEGELRVHALALFFAELECTCLPVLVFDDPASSFDYNYIANYCIRLRNFILAHTDCQVIILTHNWEFFVQLQSTLNNCGLDSKLSVQVLENCTVVSDYSEKIDVLERDITTILFEPNEPTKQQKEEVAGKMRRLIEAIVNTHVFNGQRHQYKQRSQSVSVFHKYTKVTRLQQTEATELGDLYSKLSITEHDDPRTAYVNTDKATFQTRFNRIKAIEAAIIARK